MIHVTEEDDMPGFSQRSTPGCGWQSVSSRPSKMRAAVRPRCVATDRTDAAATAASRGSFITGMAVIFASARNGFSRKPSLAVNRRHGFAIHDPRGGSNSYCRSSRTTVGTVSPPTPKRRVEIAAVGVCRRKSQIRVGPTSCPQVQLKPVAEGKEPVDRGVACA